MEYFEGKTSDGRRISGQVEGNGGGGGEAILVILGIIVLVALLLINLVLEIIFSPGIVLTACLDKFFDLSLGWKITLSIILSIGVFGVLAAKSDDWFGDSAGDDRYEKYMFLYVIAVGVSLVLMGLSWLFDGFIWEMAKDLWLIGDLLG